MTTLLLNGSPRPKGDTAYLIDLFTAIADDDVHVFHCFKAHISPCVDCRACLQKDGCALQDDMQTLYPLLEDCDCLILAGPVYFSLPTPPLLSILSRMQTYFCEREYRGTPTPIKPKRGGLLITAGGQSGSAQPAIDTMQKMLRVMQVKGTIPVVSALHTDTQPIRRENTLNEQIQALVRELYTQA